LLNCSLRIEHQLIEAIRRKSIICLRECWGICLNNCEKGIVYLVSGAQETASEQNDEPKMPKRWFSYPFLCRIMWNQHSGMRKRTVLM
jgi:hypothetical protein